MSPADWASIHATALRYTWHVFESAIAQGKLVPEDVANDATMRTWVACIKRPDLVPEDLIFVMVRRAGIDHIRSASRRPVTQPMPEGYQVADSSAGGDPAGEPEETLMWAAVESVVVERIEESLRRVAGHDDRLVFWTQCGLVALAVIRRLAVSPLYRQFYAEEPRLAVWGLLREVLPEFGGYPANHLPPENDPRRQSAYRLIKKVRELITPVSPEE